MVSFKRILSACLAGCMVLGLAACSKGGNDGGNDGGNAVSEPREDGSNPGAISEKVIEPDYFFNTGSYLYTGEEPIFETIEYYTNIKFKPIPVPLTSWNEKVATTLASNNLPDFMVMRGADKENALKGPYLDLTPYIEEGKMPNFMNMIKEHPPADALIKAPNGKIYGVPRIYDGVVMDEAWLARYDILEKHNLELPETFEELYQLLVDLKELYPDSYPYISRWGFGHCINGIGDYFNARDTMMIDLDTHKYSFGPAQPGYVDCLQFLTDCYQNGLLHPEFATLSDEQFMEAFANNKAFITYDYQIGDSLVQTNGDTLDEGFDIHAFPQPTAPNGKRYGTWVLKGYYGMTRFIASNSEYKEELVRYMDWLYSEEGIQAMTFGIEGKMYTEDAEGNVTFTEPEKYDPRVAENTGLHDTGFATVMSDKGQRVLDFVPGSMAEASYKVLEESGALGDDPRTGASWYNKDEQKEYSDIMTPINTYVEEMSMKIVLGDMEVSDWEAKVLPELEKMGYKRALELINKALDETLGQ